MSPERQVFLIEEMVQTGIIRDGGKTAAVISEFKEADVDGDGTISRHEFMAWYLKRKQKKAAGGEGAGAVPPASWGQLWVLFIAGAVPFVGFGFLDNAIMLTAGDAIEVNLGVTLGIGTLAAAGLGNLFSDVAGLGLSGEKGGA